MERRDDIDGESLGTPPSLASRASRTTWIALALSVLVFALLLVAAGQARAESYYGVRWPSASKTICVDITNVKSSQVKAAMKEAVVDMRDNTKLKLTIRGSETCKSLGYSQRVVVYDGYYGSTNACWYACSDLKVGSWKWKKVPTAGPWTNNGWTWTFYSPPVIKFNRSKFPGLTAKERSSVASHELAHTVGLDHNSRCASVMQASLSGAKKRGCKIYRNLTWRDRVGYWSSDPGINMIYKNG